MPVKGSAKKKEKKKSGTRDSLYNILQYRRGVFNIHIIYYTTPGTYMHESNGIEIRPRLKQNRNENNDVKYIKTGEKFPREL